MNETQLELTRLLGSKELTFGCLCKDMWGYMYMIHNPAQFLARKDEIIGHPPTLTDFHRWMNENEPNWVQSSSIRILRNDRVNDIVIPYDSSKPLLDQSHETLSAILKLVKSYE